MHSTDIRWTLITETRDYVECNRSLRNGLCLCDADHKVQEEGRKEQKIKM